MERGGDLQSLVAEFGVYRRTEIEHFVTWARSTILRLRQLAEDSMAQARAAEKRAFAAEAEAAEERGKRIALERTLANRDRDMQASLGKALLLAQETVETANARAAELVARAQAEADQAKAQAAAAGSNASVEASMIWSPLDDDDPLLAPLRIARASGE